MLSIVHLNDQSAIVDLAAQELGDVVGSVVQPVICADDLQIAVTGIRRRIARPGSRARTRPRAGVAAVVIKLAGVDARAFLVRELLYTATGIARGDAQRLVRANRGIAAQVLIVYAHHPVSREHRAHARRHVDAAISSAPIGIHHLPAGTVVSGIATTTVAIKLAGIDGAAFLVGKHA